MWPKIVGDFVGFSPYYPIVNLKRKTACPTKLFLLLFIKQKKFTETIFSKLLSNPYQYCFLKDFTNYFWLLYPLLKSIDVFHSFLHLQLNCFHLHPLLTVSAMHIMP